MRIGVVPVSAVMLGVILSVAGAARAQEPAVAQPKPPEAKPSSTAPAAADPFDKRTPEGALRAFLLAMMLSDRELLADAMLPEAEEDAAYLIGKPGSGPPRLVAGPMAATIGVRRLKAGETLTLPGGREFVISENEFGDDRTIVIMTESPLPTRLRKVDGQWRVDARPIIAARKAAAAQRATSPAPKP